MKERRETLAKGDGLSPATQQTVDVALRQIDALGVELEELRAEFTQFTRRQPGCRALTAEYGSWLVTAVAIWAQLGDCGCLSSSRDAIRQDEGLGALPAELAPGGCGNGPEPNPSLLSQSCSCRRQA